MRKKWHGLNPDDDLVVMADQCLQEFTDPSQRGVLLENLARQESWANADFAKRFADIDFLPDDESNIPG